MWLKVIVLAGGLLAVPPLVGAAAPADQVMALEAPRPPHVPVSFVGRLVTSGVIVGFETTRATAVVRPATS